MTNPYLKSGQIRVNDFNWFDRVFSEPHELVQRVEEITGEQVVKTRKKATCITAVTLSGLEFSGNGYCHK